MIQFPHPSQIGDIVESQPQAGRTEEARPTKRRGVDESVPITIDGVGDEEDDDEDGVDDGVRAEGANGMWTKKAVEIPESECDFTSILELRDEVKKKDNQGRSQTPCLFTFTISTALLWSLSIA